MAATDSPQPKADAPPSTGPTLEQVKEKAPAVLYFIKSSCGSNPMAIPLVQKIYAANEKGGKFYAVMDADEKSAKEWAKGYNATFPIIADPDKKIIKQYKVEASQTGILVDKDLKETKRFPGYGKASLAGLNASLSEPGKAANVDLSAAPESGVG